MMSTSGGEHESIKHKRNFNRAPRENLSKIQLVYQVCPIAVGKVGVLDRVSIALHEVLT